MAFTIAGAAKSLFCAAALIAAANSAKHEDARRRLPFPMVNPAVVPAGCRLSRRAYEHYKPTADQLGLFEIPLARLTPIHPIPRIDKPRLDIPDSEAHVRAFMANYERNHYLYLLEDGTRAAAPISALLMPDGKLLIASGHHRIEALRRLGETTVPVTISLWREMTPAMIRTLPQIYPMDAFLPYLR